MVFLIEYDRENGTLIKLREFLDSDSKRAEDLRIELEVKLMTSGIAHEVVLLQAPNKDALRQTHGRYFANLSELSEIGEEKQ